MFCLCSVGQVDWYQSLEYFLKNKKLENETVKQNILMQSSVCVLLDK